RSLFGGLSGLQPDLRGGGLLRTGAVLGRGDRVHVKRAQRADELEGFRRERHGDLASVAWLQLEGRRAELQLRCVLVALAVLGSPPVAEGQRAGARRRRAGRA